MLQQKSLAVLILVSAGSVSLPAHAQLTAADDVGAITACPSQQELEQIIDSAGDIESDECTTISVSRLTSSGAELCLVDFGMDQGFLGRLRDAAFPTQWWVRCDQFKAALE